MPVTVTYIYLNNYSLGLFSGEAVILVPDVVDDMGTFLNYSPIPNQWFNKNLSKYDSERELLQVVQREVYNTFGTPITYYQVTYDQNYDKIFGEDLNRMVVNYWQNIMTMTRFEREHRLFNKFAIDNINDRYFFISKSHFDYETDGYIPQMGDIIKDVFKFYEIVEVKEDVGNMLASKQFCWTLYCTTMKDDFSISLSANCLGTELSAYINTSADDIFDNRNEIDIVNENIKYNEKSNEQNPNNPWGVW